SAGGRRATTAHRTAASTRRTRSAPSSRTPRRAASTVLPEIELPGRSAAAFVAYPELARGEPPREARTTWGHPDVVFRPGEAAFAFLEDVLGEVAALFPFRYIHIGGDEAPKTRWKACADAQAIIRREGLRDEDHLQSWAIARRADRQRPRAEDGGLGRDPRGRPRPGCDRDVRAAGRAAASKRRAWGTTS
ncbi:MAG: hypothetical protein FJ028_05175, partial [Chloroflexi bacterium]|nr:hypothetical protein [Chloroflexota bacterium]